METSRKIRIAICDDHPVIRFGLSQVINNEPDIEVVLEAPSSEQLIENFAATKPDITILDLELDDESGIDCLREIRNTDPNAKVIIYTAHNDSDCIMEAIELDIQGYLLKQSECNDIVRNIRVVYNGGTTLEPGIATKLLARMRHQQTRQDTVLSKRESQVLGLLSLGKTNRDIARTLFISERTVKFHVSSILEKLNAKNRTEAALFAKQNNLVAEMAVS